MSTCEKGSKRFSKLSTWTPCDHFGRPNDSKCLFGGVQVGVWNFKFVCYPQGNGNNLKNARKLTKFFVVFFMFLGTSFQDGSKKPPGCAQTHKIKNLDPPSGPSDLWSTLPAFIVLKKIWFICPAVPPSSFEKNIYAEKMVKRFLLWTLPAAASASASR